MPIDSLTARGVQLSASGNSSMTEIDTAEIRALWSDPLNQAMGGRTVVALCAEIDRLRSERDAFKRSNNINLEAKDTANAERRYHENIADDLRAQLARARAEALEEAAKVCDEIADDHKRTVAIDPNSDMAGEHEMNADGAIDCAASIRALASSGGEKGERG